MTRRRKTPAGPSLFDDDVTGSGAGEGASRAAHATASSPEPARLDYATDPPSPVIGVSPLETAMRTLAGLDTALVERIGQDVLEDMLIHGSGPKTDRKPVGITSQVTHDASVKTETAAQRLVDQVATEADELTIAQRATLATESVAHHYKMSQVEREASFVAIPDRSRWAYPGKGEIEVRGTSPLFVWFTAPGADALTQQTLYRHVFLKGAKRL